MEIKLLGVLIYIMFLFLVSNVARAEEENSTKFKIPPITTDPLKEMLFRIQSNVDYLRQLFGRDKKDNLDIISAIKKEKSSDRKILIIKELIEEIVYSIHKSSLKIYNARFNIKNEPFSMSDDMTNDLFSVLDNVSLFGDIIFHFPDMGPKVGRLEKKFIELLLLSAQYVDSYEKMLDESSIAVISSATKKLNKIKEKSGKKYLSNKKKSKKRPSKNMKLDL